MADPQWYTKQGPDGKWYKTQAASPEEATRKLLTAIGGPTSTTAPRMTAVDKMFPEGGTVGVPHPRTGFAGVEDTLTNLKSRLDQHLQRGIGPGAGDYIPFVNIPGGLLKILRGAAKGAELKPWQATKDIAGGGLQALSGPLGFMAPESSLAKASTITPASTVRSLTDAINPPVKQMARFEKSLGEQLDKIISFAAQKGIKLDSVENVAQAMKEAATSIRQHYYEKILAPFKDVSVGDTTLGRLDSRLSQINAELASRYAKTGDMAARAAVKSEFELNNEAAAIRNTLYSKLGDVTGLGKEVIASTRKAFGTLESLSETTQEAASASRHAANVASREPWTLNPLSNTKQFIADKALAKLQGNPVQKAIRNAMSRADIPRYELPEINPPVAAKVPRAAPIRGFSWSPSEPIVSTREEIEAIANKLSARRAANEAANTKAQLDKSQKALNDLYRSSRHPFWKNQPWHEGIE